jgi:hypothetical protein
MMGIYRLVSTGFGALTATLFLGLSVAGSLSAQTVYKSVDDAGHVAFTDRPPLQQADGDKPLDVMELQIQLTDPELIAANREASQADARANGVAADIRSKHDAEDAVEQAAKDQKRAENCDFAKARLTKYSQVRRLYREGDDGERAYLSDEEIDTERANAARAIDKWCGN